MESTDVKRLSRFYQEILGFEQIQSPDFGGGLERIWLHLPPPFSLHLIQRNPDSESRLPDLDKHLLSQMTKPPIESYETYEKVATTFKSEEEVVVANVDADTHKDLAEKYGLSGFPTLKFFPKNNKDGEGYEGGREVDAFVNFLNDKCGTSRDAKGQLTLKEAEHIAFKSSAALLLRPFSACYQLTT